MAKSSFHGIIDEIPFISVDNFTNLKKRAYFLSHCHTDHTEGLYSDEFLQYLMKSGDVYIYMSEPSAAIVAYETKNERLVEYIRPLKLEKTTILIPSDAQNNIPEQYLTVTPIPAGHCFGSIMFLYQTKLKTVLYTGDFRINPDNLHKYTQFYTKEHNLCSENMSVVENNSLQSFSNNEKTFFRNKNNNNQENNSIRSSENSIYQNNSIINIDTLYVDTTFQNHVNLPKRSETVKYVLKETKEFLKRGCIALHTSAKYGYEDVCNQIFDKLGVKVYVGDVKWKLYSKFPHQCRGMTNDYNQTSIHICTNRNEHMSHDKCLPLTETRPFLYIHFSALKWANYEIDELMIEKSEKRINVCYPTHCSRTELLYFINYFKIGRVVGFPEPFWSLEKRDVKRKCMENDLKSKVPKKVDKDLLKDIFD